MGYKYIKYETTKILTHWPQGQVAIISNKSFLNVFYLLISLEFCLEFPSGE